MHQAKIVGIDIGGTHVSASLVDLSMTNADVQSLVRMNVDPMGSIEETIEAWARCIQRCFDQDLTIERKRIGIAMPGPFDYENGISYITGLNKFECLYRLPVKTLLAERLSIPPEDIRMVNDASAFLLGEMMIGAGRGFTKAAGITLGTGAGSATFSDNNIQDGDLWCTEYRASRVEDYLCANWFSKEYEKLTGKRVHDVKALINLYYMEPCVQTILASFSEHLAEVLLLKYPPHMQDVIIVGGNIARAWNYFIPAAQQYFRERGVVMNLQPAQLGEHAAIAGAAYLWR